MERPASAASRRRKLSIGLLLAAFVVVPAAIAWACNPQAHVSLDRTSYAPGQTITVYGSYFPNNATITVTGPGSSQQVTAAGGGFVTSFTAPSDAGSYVISASRPTGGFASASYSVVAPAAAPAPRAEAPPASAPPRQSFDTPGVTRSERAPSTSGGGGDNGGGGGNNQSAPGEGGSGTGGSVQTVAGQPVFVGSAAPSTTAGTFATTPAAAETNRGAARERRASAAPSEQAASGDVWSGFAPGRTASLTAGADGMSDGGPGSELGLGIGLLVLGLLGLAGGLTAAEVRRRRTA